MFKTARSEKFITSQKVNKGNYFDTKNSRATTFFNLHHKFIFNEVNFLARKSEKARQEDCHICNERQKLRRKMLNHRLSER